MKAHIIWIVFIKIIFIILSLVYLLMPNSKAGQYKDKVETIFFISMAILLIYMFNPYIPHTAITEEKQLLFLFGVIILITTKWKKLLSTT